MRNIQVCHDVGTLFIDRDGTTVLLEIRVYHYLSLTIGDPVDVTTLLQGMQSRDSYVQREQAPALCYCIQEP